MIKSPTATPLQPLSNKTSSKNENGEASSSVAVVDILPYNEEKALTSSPAEEKPSADNGKTLFVDKMKMTLTEQHIIDMAIDTISIYSEGQCFCRICHGSGDEEPLIAPCRCAGSAQWVHSTCLITWLKKSMRETCELCRCRIKIEKKVKSVSEWQLPQTKPFSIAWCIIFFLGLAINLVAIILHAVQQCVSSLCVVFYVCNSLGIVINILLLVGWIPGCVVYCRKWFALNEKWVLTSEKESNDQSLDNDKGASNKKNEMFEK